MPEAGGALHGVAHGLDAGAVAFDARQMALGRPPAVAVHDDRDVRRQAVERDLPRQRGVRIPGGNPRQQFVKRHAGILEETST